jgi:hypothetical protein
MRLDSICELKRHWYRLRMLIMNLSPTLMIHLHISDIRLTTTLRSWRILIKCAAYNWYPLTWVSGGRLWNSRVRMPQRRPWIAIKWRFQDLELLLSMLIKDSLIILWFPFLFWGLHLLSRILTVWFDLLSGGLSCLIDDLLIILHLH